MILRVFRRISHPHPTHELFQERAHEILWQGLRHPSLCSRHHYASPPKPVACMPRFSLVFPKSEFSESGVLGAVTSEVENRVCTLILSMNYDGRLGEQSMANLPRNGHSGIDAMQDLKWSPAEKSVARKAFDRALRRELEATIVETKKRAEKIQQPTDLWDLEHYLSERRTQIDRLFDYRYSVLIWLFGNLIRQGILSEQELQGLSEDKLDFDSPARNKLSLAQLDLGPTWSANNRMRYKMRARSTQSQDESTR